MATVLLVEDDPAARQGLELALHRLGYGVRAAETGESALRDFRDVAADVVVLDVMLPGLDGFEVCRRLRRDSDIPVIMLTARDDDLDIVGGLEAGADDYVVKPVEPRVLEARIRAVLRRTVRAGSPVETYGELMIDRGSLIVRRAGAGVLPGAVARPGVGARLPGGLPAGRRVRAAAAGEDRDRHVRAPLHPDRPGLRVPVRAGVAGEWEEHPVRTRLIIAFIVVALLSALAASWFHTLIGAYRLPTWLDDVILGPPWLQDLVHTLPGQPAPHPVRHTALIFFGVEAGLLLAVITIAAIAA